MAERTTMPMKRDDTTLRRWDPFEVFETLQDDMDRFWRRPGFWGGPFPQVFRRGAGRAMTWAPRTDFYVKDNNIIVKAELPGLKKEDVQVEVDNAGNLVIRGETKSESEVKEEAYYRMERSACCTCLSTYPTRPSSLTAVSGS